MIILLYVKKENYSRQGIKNSVHKHKKKKERINWHSVSKHFLIGSRVCILGQAQSKQMIYDHVHLILDEKNCK